MHHLSIRAAVVGSAFLIAIAHRSALATPDAGALCASAKLVAASAYAACKLRAEARLAKTGDVRRWEAAVASCASRLAARYERAETQFGVTCPTRGDVADAVALLSQCADDVAAATSGEGYPPTPTPSSSPTPTPTPDITPSYPTPTPMGRLVGYSGIEFSATQGRSNWHYGTYPDAPASFSFVPMSEFEARSDPGPGRWWANREGAWASIWATGQSPAGETSSCGKTATGDWAVRRWVSTVYTPVRISGLTGKPEPGSDGVQVYVIVDGQIVFTRLVPGDEPEPVHYEVTAPVSIGSTVDFAVSANGSDCGDAVTFVGIIEEVGW